MHSEESMTILQLPEQCNFVRMRCTESPLVESSALRPSAAEKTTGASATLSIWGH